MFLLYRNRNDLAQILELLKTQIDPSLLVKKDQEEGSSSNSPNPDTAENKEKKDDGMFNQMFELVLQKIFCIVLYRLWI